jgi:hypothetical protein
MLIDFRAEDRRPLRDEQVLTMPANLVGDPEDGADFKPRKAEDLERGDLQWRYGAVPFFGDFVAVGE